MRRKVVSVKSIFIYSFLVLVALPLVCCAQSNAIASDCGNSPRVVGLFGAMDEPVPAVPASDTFRTLFPDVKDVRAVQQTSLAVSGEQMAMYDTSADAIAPEPRIAVIANNAVVATFDVSKLVPHGVQAIYRSSCQFQLHAGQRGFVIAYTLSGDGTGSAFVLLAHTSGAYRAVFSRLVCQGRLVFKVGTFELWDCSRDRRPASAESEDFECEWCDHRYLITTYAWRKGGYLKTASRRTKTAYDPAEITGTPVVIRTLAPTATR